MYKISLSTIILLIFSTLIHAQNTCELFFGGDEYEAGESFQQTTDGGFIITGLTETFAVGLYDGYLLKLDNDCNLLWQTSFGGQSSDNANQVIQTMDGGYMIAGRSVQGADDWRYLRKVESNGELEWEQSYSGAGNISSIQQLPDGNYVFAGSILNQNNGQQLSITKITSTGTVLWEESFGGPADETGTSIAIAADGGYVATGESRINAWPPQIYVVKLNEAGDLVWEKSIGEDTWTEGRDIKATPDGGFVIAGRKDNPIFGLENDCHMVKIDSEGEVEWAKSYGDEGFQEAEGVTVTSDGGYGLVGKSIQSAVGGLYFVKTDENGTIEFERNFGGMYFAAGFDIIELEEGGYALLGTARDIDLGTWDLYFIKTNENGEVISTSTLDINPNEIPVEVFPNPTNDDLSFTIDSNVKLPIRLKLSTASGTTVLDQQISDHTIVIKSNQLAKGMLYYSFYNKDGYLKTGKIISN